VSKILFIRGGAIGDFILTMPAIQLVRDTLPETRVEVLGYESITSLAKAASLVEATRSIEHGPMAGFFVPDGKLDSELMDYFGSFSVVISYLYDSDGFFRDNVERCEVNTFIQAPHRIDESLGNQSAAAQLAKPLESLALYLEKPYFEYPASANPAACRRISEPINDKSEGKLVWKSSRLAAGSFQLPADFGDNADAVLSEQDKSQTSPRIALHPGSGSPRKNWSLEGWVEVVEELQQKFPGAEFVIISGEAEERSIGDCLALLDKAKVNWRHLEHLDLPTLASALQQCDLFLGHDSGISHLAAACGVPTALLFGPTDPKIWAPQNPGVKTIVATEGDLSRIEADEVVGVAAGLLSGA